LDWDEVLYGSESRNSKCPVVASAFTQIPFKVYFAMVMLLILMILLSPENVDYSRYTEDILARILKRDSKGQKENLH
jgi:hypothetical protein